MSVQRITQLPSPPSRPSEAHKGTFGRVLILGGSRGMSGAACLAGLGALRGGAGLVFLAVPWGIVPIVAAVDPSYLTVPLPEDGEGRLSMAAQDELADVIPKNTALAIGPGWGLSDELLCLAKWLFTTVELPMVIDADALNALSQMLEVLPQHPENSDCSASRILTPHPGEFARMLGVDVAAVQKNREELAIEFAKHNGVVLLLKGRGTIITDGERLAVNTTGNSGMATGGSGDVLTGLIAALLAQGMPAFEAAQLAAHLHGFAGNLAAEELSKPGMIASDLPGYLPKAWQDLDA